MATFKSTMVNWLCAHGFSNLDIDFEEDFGYAYDDTVNCINIGTKRFDDVSNYFEQFLYEYGCEYCGIPGPVLSFIHELGHFMTISNFSNEELWFCAFAKKFDHGGTDQEEFFRYWEMPDEFAANMWAVDYINNHIDEVEDLTNTFFNAWKGVAI